MEEYKSNSNKSKNKTVPENSEPRAKGVVSGVARTKKKNGVQKFADTFIAEDVANVRSYIWNDIIVPTVKRALYDSFTDGLDMMLNGSTGNRYRNSNRNGGTRISYDKAYSRAAYQQRDRDAAPRRVSDSRFDFDPIIFPTRGDAERVLEELDEVIERYEIVSVQDLYIAAKINDFPYTYNNYGWYDIRSAQIVRSQRDNGYMIKLPKPEPINK